MMQISVVFSNSYGSPNTYRVWHIYMLYMRVCMTQKKEAKFEEPTLIGKSQMPPQRLLH